MLIGMRTRFTLLVVLLSIYGTACRHSPSASLNSEPPATWVEPARVFLWEATSESGGGAYLLGSIHLAKPELYPLDPAIEEAYASADSLVVEVDLNETEEAEMAAIMMQAGVYGDGRKMLEELTPETAELFTAYLEERSLPTAMFNSMRPWMAAMMITVVEMQRLGYQPEFGIDKHFLNQAKEGGKPVRQLETARFQIDLLSSFPEKLQDTFLRQTLIDQDRVGDMIDEMISSWRDGQVETLEEILVAQSEDPEMQAVNEAMIDDRNHAMAEKIAAMIEAGETPFVVVGALHLVGDEGVVRLLEDAGYQVRQVEAAAVAAGAVP